MSTKVALILGLFLLVALQALGQEVVTIHVTLHPVQSIDINPIQEQLNISYMLFQDENEEDEVLQKEELLLFSTSPYELTVNVTELNLPGIRVEAIPRQDTEFIGITEVNLSHEHSKLIQSHKSQQKGYFDLFHKGVKNTSAQILYSIAPK